MTRNDPTIVVEIDDELIVLVGNPESFVIQSDNPEYVKKAKAYTENVKSVQLIHGMPYKVFPTGKTTFLELTASLVAVDPGQAVILTAPDEVLNALIETRGPTGNSLFL
jgi:hypothetical protein